MLIKTLTILCVTLLTMQLAACETIGGAGRDIENAGEAVQKSAN